jgi:hypothetical protein
MEEGCGYEEVVVVINDLCSPSGPHVLIAPCILDDRAER